MNNSKKKVEEFIRVDHAGERGAVKIYEGQLLALNTVVKDEDLKKSLYTEHFHKDITKVIFWTFLKVICKEHLV